MQVRNKSGQTDQLQQRNSYVPTSVSVYSCEFFNDLYDIVDSCIALHATAVVHLQSSIISRHGCSSSQHQHQCNRYYRLKISGGYQLHLKNTRLVVSQKVYTNNDLRNSGMMLHCTYHCFLIPTSKSVIPRMLKLTNSQQQTKNSLNLSCIYCRGSQVCNLRISKLNVYC